MDANTWKTLENFGQKIENFHHALIGGDGRYTKVGTMAYPSKAKLNPEEKKIFNQNSTSSSITLFDFSKFKKSNL